MYKVKKYVAENKKATRLVGQIGFHQNGVPIELQQSGYIGSVTYKNQNVNIQGKPFSAENPRGQTKKTVIRLSFYGGTTQT